MERNLTIIFLIILLNLIGLRTAHSVNPLVAIEGVGLGIEILKKGTDKVKEVFTKDKDKDKDNVSQKASELGRQQNPSLVGNPEQVLARY